MPIKIPITLWCVFLKKREEKRREEKRREEKRREEKRKEEKRREKKRTRLFQLEGTYKDHQVQLPDHFRADQKLKYVVKGIVQMSLKC